jgi:hypothetical protein
MFSVGLHLLPDHNRIRFHLRQTAAIYILSSCYSLSFVCLALGECLIWTLNLSQHNPYHILQAADEQPLDAFQQTNR